MTEQFCLQGKRVLVTGHQGMVGSAIVRRLQSEDCLTLTIARRHDLRDWNTVSREMESVAPDVVIHAAGKVGGIVANRDNQVDFLSDNARMALNVIEKAHSLGVQRLLFLASSCAYPRQARQPIDEGQLLAGELEPTNVGYAIAKLAGIKLCDAYFGQFGRIYNSLMPTNLFGPCDNYDPVNSHVPAALIQRFHNAKVSGAPSVTIWGSGEPRREFMHVDDLADACVFGAQNWLGAGVLNVGTGTDVSIAEFAATVADVVGYSARIEYDRSKPDGAPRKLLDVSMMTQLGWKPGIDLRSGLENSYRWFVDNVAAKVAA